MEDIRYLKLPTSNPFQKLSLKLINELYIKNVLMKNDINTK